jgi:hypothetical protein
MQIRNLLWRIGAVARVRGVAEYLDDRKSPQLPAGREHTQESYRVRVLHVNGGAFLLNLL